MALGDSVIVLIPAEVFRPGHSERGGGAAAGVAVQCGGSAELAGTTAEGN